MMFFYFLNIVEKLKEKNVDTSYSNIKEIQQLDKTFVMSLWIILFILIIIYIVYIFYRKYIQSITYKLIKPSEISEIFAERKSFFLLDLRSLEDYNESRIQEPDAVIQYPILEYASKHLPKNKKKKILMYSKNGMDDFYAGIILKDIGYTNLFSIKGGFTNWVKEGFPVNKQMRSKLFVEE